MASVNVHCPRCQSAQVPESNGWLVKLFASRAL
ncbi:hypothetical protein A6856_23910 [Salmonella enterica]|nr:hypothetical protein [Salmonella enterica]EAS2027940.1 hypothetical protein [Salmonella enterica]EAU0259679.1 hypothetical protein [Salmonella enterica]